MNRLQKWLGEFSGRRLCHYCPDTWLSKLASNGNCMSCPKCGTTYIYAWQGKVTWPRKWKPGMDTKGDPNRLEYIQIHYSRLVDHITQDCIVLLDIRKKKTQIILDFPTWTFSNPTLTINHLVNITPFNVKDKVKRLLLFS